MDHPDVRRVIDFDEPVALLLVAVVHFLTDAEKPGQVVASTAQGFTVHAQGGFIDVVRCRFDEGAKIAAGEAGLAPGTLLGQ